MFGLWVMYSQKIILYYAKKPDASNLTLNNIYEFCLKFQGLKVPFQKRWFFWTLFNRSGFTGLKLTKSIPDSVWQLHNFTLNICLCHAPSRPATPEPISQLQLSIDLYYFAASLTQLSTHGPHVVSNNSGCRCQNILDSLPAQTHIVARVAVFSAVMWVCGS